MPNPVIDVLIPTYNPNPEHLVEALKSLQGQTLWDWTALVHDDCSKTDTEGIVTPYLFDERIRFVRSDKRLGIGGNWNASAASTSSPLVAYLFQDDIWAPNYLTEAVKILDANPTVGCVSMEHTYAIEENMPTVDNYQAIRELYDAQAMSGQHSGKEILTMWLDRELVPNIIGEPSFVVMRRNIMNQAGPFLTDMSQLLDVEYWTRILAISDWYCLRGNFGTFRVHEKGASAVHQEAGKGLFDRLRCFGLLIERLPEQEKLIAIAAREKALKSMVTKFRSRVTSGKSVSAHGSGELRKFCLRHPLLILKAIIQSYRSGK